MLNAECRSLSDRPHPLPLSRERARGDFLLQLGGELADREIAAGGRFDFIGDGPCRMTLAPVS